MLLDQQKKIERLELCMDPTRWTSGMRRMWEAYNKSLASAMYAVHREALITEEKLSASESLEDRISDRKYRPSRISAKGLM